MKKFVMMIMLMCAVCFAYNTPNYTEQGGERTVIGAYLDIITGGEIDIESGGALKIGGVAVNASAAQLNVLATDNGIESSMPAGDTIQYVTVEISNTELEALNTTPKELVAAPGAGKAIEFISAALFYDWNTADFNTQGDLTIYSETTETAYSDTIDGGDFLLGSADAYRLVQALSDDVQLDVNEAIVIQVDTADPTDPGTAAGSLTVKVSYRIHDFN
jgi:hypothetical protein